MNIERTIALRYMRARRQKNFISFITIISVLGVGVGVAALIVVMAVMSGFETNLKSKFLGITSHVVITSLDGSIQGWPGLVEELKALPGVKSVEPFVYGQALVTGAGGASGLMIKGIDPEIAAREGQLSNISPTPGSLEIFLNAEKQDPDYPPLILGRELSSRINAYQYDLVRVLSPFGRVTPLGSRAPLTKEYQVAGTFHSGVYEYDSNLAYMPLGEVQKLMAMEDGVSTLEIMVEDIYSAGEVKERALEYLGPGFWGVDWMQRNVSLYAALKLEQAAMFVVLTLIIVVAAFNIVSTLVMMVMEKTRDIAILKSMGATRRQVRRIFTIQGLAVGLVGALGGLVVGVSLCLILQRYKFISLPADVFMMDSLPVEMRLVNIVATVVLTVVVSYLATIYPARKAASLDPVEALRYE